MAKRIVTISRQFGSGGRAVGQMVADSLGVRCYDRALIGEIAAKSGLAPDYIQDYGEYATSTSSFLYNLDLHGGFTGGSLPIPDQLYIVQHNLINELAEREPCVIVGRCADYALRERGDCLHIFLHADEAFRADRIIRLYGETDEMPASRLKETDDKRRVYYKFYTGMTWGMAENYHLCLDSGAVGIDLCAEIVTELVKSL